MQAEFDKLVAYARSAWRFRYQAALTTWIVAALGWFAVFLIPNQYETTARVYVDTNTLLRPLHPLLYPDRLEEKFTAASIAPSAKDPRPRPNPTSCCKAGFIWA